MADKIYPTDTPSGNGYQLSEANLSQADARDNASDYVERGLTFTADHANLELDISSGYALLTDANNQRYHVYPDQRLNLSLIDSKVNEVYLTINPVNGDEMAYEIITDGSTPSGTYLKLGEVDTSADTTTEVNREPNGTYNALTFEESITDSEGNTLSTLSDAAAVADTATASGDGTTVTFSLSHSLGSTPTAANVSPTSEDASTDFWISNKTTSAVEITFARAPATGTDNLSFDLITQL